MPRKAKRDADTNFETGEHAGDLKELAYHCIKRFLQSKAACGGGPIPPYKLFDAVSYRTVLRTPFDDPTFAFIHAACLPAVPPDPAYRDNTVSWPVHFLLGLIAELKAVRAPKDFQPGLLLLYFKFCHGVPVPAPPDL